MAHRLLYELVYLVVGQFINRKKKREETLDLAYDTDFLLVLANLLPIDVRSYLFNLTMLEFISQ